MTARALVRVAFRREVPSPRAESFARTHWIDTFAEPEFAIVLDVDTLRITHRATGRTYAYPFSAVAGFEEPPPPRELEQQKPAPRLPPAPLPRKGAVR